MTTIIAGKLGMLAVVAGGSSQSPMEGAVANRMRVSAQITTAESL
jgi:hypothetical protein